MKHILLIKNDNIIKNYEKMDNKIIFNINMNTNNNNRVFFINSIEYIIIYYNEYRDKLNNLIKMKKIYDNYYKYKDIKPPLILYCFIKDIEIKNNEILSYINENFTNR